MDHANLILPGTHSNHVIVKHGRIVNFQTVLTGKLFAVLNENSVLRYSIRGPVKPQTAAFTAGVQAATGLPVTAALTQILP